MAANPNWTRWIFASVATYLKEVAAADNLPVLVEHFDERSESFQEASDRAEIRITGPHVRKRSLNDFYVRVEANVLLTSRYDGALKNAFEIHKAAGKFQEALSKPIPVWNYGLEPGDYVDGQPATQLHLGCLQTVDGRNDYVRVFHFGQIHETDKLKQTAVDAKLEMDLTV